MVNYLSYLSSLTECNYGRRKIEEMTPVNRRQALISWAV